MKLKFFVIGSCYSGYMFKEKILGNLTNGNIEMVYQHQHDSFISMMTKPVDMDLKGATSQYQWDFNHFADSIFNKDIIEKIKKTRPDYILFDTYAEAFCPIIKVDEDSYITSNYYIKTSTVYEKLKGREVLDVNDVKRYELFKKCVVEFFQAVRAELPDVKLILVRSSATTELYNPLKKEHSIFSYYKKIESTNELRLKYEQCILENVPDVRSLSMRDEYNVADSMIQSDYNYEISHNHYTVDFYRRMYHKLQRIILADLLGGQEKTKYFNQAICIIATDDFSMLLLQAKIYKDFFRVYINIDVGSIGVVYTDEQIDRLRKIPNVCVLAKYKSPKGSYNELVAMLEMAAMGFDNPDVKYVHYTTGDDMPIRPINEIYKYFETSAKDCSYLNNYSNGDRDEMKKVAEYTYKYYNYLYNADERDPVIRDMLHESICHQKKNGIERNAIGEFTDVYKGVIGASLSREAYMYCMEYVKKHPEYMEDIKFTRLCSEFFFQTILFNAKELEGKVCGGIRGGRHDWLWDSVKKDYAEVDLESYKKLRAGEDSLFIRKVTSKNSEVLKEILKDIKTPYYLE